MNKRHHIEMVVRSKLALLIHQEITKKTTITMMIIEIIAKMITLIIDVCNVL